MQSEFIIIPSHVGVRFGRAGGDRIVECALWEQLCASCRDLNENETRQEKDAPLISKFKQFRFYMSSGGCEGLHGAAVIRAVAK